MNAKLAKYTFGCEIESDSLFEASQQCTVNSHLSMCNVLGLKGYGLYECII